MLFFFITYLQIIFEAIKKTPLFPIFPPVIINITRLCQKLKLVLLKCFCNMKFSTFSLGLHIGENVVFTT